MTDRAELTERDVVLREIVGLEPYVPSAIDELRKILRSARRTLDVDDNHRGIHELQYQAIIEFRHSPEPDTASFANGRDFAAGVLTGMLVMQRLNQRASAGGAEPTLETIPEGAAVEIPCKGIIPTGRPLPGLQ